MTTENRKAERYPFSYPVEISRVSQPDLFLYGSLVDIQSEGVRLSSRNLIFPGEQVRIACLSESKNTIMGFVGTIAWRTVNSSGENLYGISRSPFTHRDMFSLGWLVKYNARRDITTSLAKLSLILLAVLFPLGHLVGIQNNPSIKATVFLFVSSFLAIERIWETFLTSREKKILSATEDWTIAAVTFYYVLMTIGCQIEFYLSTTSFSIRVSLLGAILLGGSFYLRFYGMVSLGDAWAIHALGTPHKNSVNSQISTNGPYKFVRNPIYLGVILELIAIPLLYNCFFVLLFTLIVNIPLQILRAQLEEKALVRKFGHKYISYTFKVARLFPLYGRNHRN